MMKIDSLKHEVVLRAVGRSVTVIFHDAVAAETSPLACWRSLGAVPAGGVDYGVDEIVAVCEVGYVACGFP